MRVERLGPIITPGSHRAAGSNINGPSLIEVPAWVPDPLGRYYLYFADHKGSSIRLAYADDVVGPYRMHPTGSLQLAQSGFPSETRSGITVTSRLQADAIESEGYDAHFTPHIASPDVVVDHEGERIVMAYHGLCADGSQLTRVADSVNGIDFEAHEPLVAFPYLRILPERHRGWWLGLAMPGIAYRSRDLLTWESGPILFEGDFRHGALLRSGSALQVFWSRVGDAPEHILCSTIELSEDWTTWRPEAPMSVLAPVEPWEGADLPVVASERGQVTERVNQLRDPAIYTGDGRVWLLYSFAGESGIAIAELHGLGGELSERAMMSP